MADNTQGGPATLPVFLTATKLSITMQRETEDALGMTFRQWQRLRQRILGCTHEIDRWEQAQNIGLGVFLTAILPAIEQYQKASGYGWIVIAAVSTAVWITTMAAQRSGIASQKASIASVLDEMDYIQSQFALTATATAATVTQGHGEGAA